MKDSGALQSSYERSPDQQRRPEVRFEEIAIDLLQARLGPVSVLPTRRSKRRSEFERRYNPDQPKQELAQKPLVAMSDSGSQNLDQLPLVTEASPPEESRALWVGREKELTSLQQHFQRKQPQQAVIVGQRGTGKTALAYMFREQTERSNLFPAGWQSVHATPFPDIVPSFFGDAFKTTRKQERSL